MRAIVLVTLTLLGFAVSVISYEGNIQAEYQRSKRALTSGSITKRYLRYDEMNAYLVQLATEYPRIVTVDTTGKSYEGRPMNLIRISTGSRNPPKPVIFLDAGIHAREWIAPAVALYLIQELVENSANRNLIENIDWIILPCVNPDGYEFTHTHERFWRKNRSRGAQCYGTDLNRNFGFHWGEVGASSNECSDTYMGKEAFSEIETRNLRDYILKTPNIVLYLSLSSYGEYLLFPWGYTSALPADYDELQELGETVANAIKAVRGTIYTVGTTTDVLYAAAGGSDDWVKGAANIELAYTIELPGGGPNGFDPPASEIQEIAAETFEGFKAYAQYVASKWP